MVNKDVNQAMRQYLWTKGMVTGRARTRRNAELVKWAKKVARRSIRRLSKAITHDMQ